MIVTIASGKGGTGKTTLSTNLAYSAEQPVVLLDCDVEEPNAHLFLKPVWTDSMPVYKPIPSVNPERCNSCGTCAEICEYNAIAVLKDQVLVFPELCHGCGGCTLLCPQHAIEEANQEIGIVEKGRSGAIDFVHGKLQVKEAMAGPVIRAVKQHINRSSLTIMDAPPGTSCSVVGTLLESDYCLLVTEPTPFGLHDLTLAVEVVRKLGIPHGVVINRAGVGDSGVQEYCRSEQIPILLEIPEDRHIAEAYSRGELMAETSLTYRKQFQELLLRISSLLEREG